MDHITIQAAEEISVQELEHHKQDWTKTVVNRLLAEVIRHAQKTGNAKPHTMLLTLASLHPQKPLIKRPWVLKLDAPTVEHARENAKVVQQRRAQKAKQ